MNQFLNDSVEKKTLFVDIFDKGIKTAIRSEEN